MNYCSDGEAEVPASWSRLPGQMCKLPNSPLLSLPAGKLGCLVIRFSPDGRYLACACHDKDSYPIIIYEVSASYPGSSTRQ